MNSKSPQPAKPAAMKIPRSLSRAKATVILDSDAMRLGISAKIFDLAAGHLGLLMESPPKEKEMIKIRLVNEIQRIERLVRGVVRDVSPAENDLFRVRVELYARLIPLDVLLLKAPFPDDSSLWM